jgi:hypothetical protein
VVDNVVRSIGFNLSFHPLRAKVPFVSSGLQATRLALLRFAYIEFKPNRPYEKRESNAYCSWGRGLP